MKKILVIEDDSEVSELLQTLLSPIYDVTLAYSGTEGLLLLDLNDFDLIILDMMLPGMMGSDVLKSIREKNTIPIIVLTAMNDKKMISETLLNGADDYLTKPFDVDELLARISVQLRKNGQMIEKEMESIVYKNVLLDLNSFKIKCQDSYVDLSKKESEILKLLFLHPSKVYTKEDIYQLVWKEQYFGDENTVNVHISNLRKKLAQLDKEESYIDTVWGIGIKLAD